MTRYNLFRQIHKGLRALLFDTNLLLQRTDFTMVEEAREIIERLRFVISLFEKYKDAEDIYVLPALAAYDPGIADSYEQNYEEAYQLGHQLKSLLGVFSRLLQSPEQRTAGNYITARFRAFTSFNIQRMAREEKCISKMLWQYYTDQELQQIAWKVVSRSGSALQAPYTQWLFRGLQNNEIEHWPKEGKFTTGDGRYQLLLKKAATELRLQRGASFIVCMPPMRWVLN